MLKHITLILYLSHLAIQISTKRGYKLISYSLPENRHLKKALGYYEDTYLNFTELTTKYGYPSEEHTVLTEDNYQLKVFRILTKCFQVQKFPVILGHGIFDSSDAWIFTGPDEGLAYILSNSCYDVWAVNFRGNTYSRNHVTLDPNIDPEYWEFSFDETGNYDLPAIIDYVIEVTKQPKIYYVGHSQGTTDFFVMGSLRPEYNRKIQLSIQLAPVAWMKNIRSPVSKLVAPSSNNIKLILETVGFRELLGKQQFIHMLSEFLCQISPNEVCGTALAITTGYKQGGITSKNLAVALGHLLVGVSVKTLAHFGQLIVSGSFQRFDEGKQQNIIRYKSMKPPNYDVSLITSPVILVSARNDWLSTFKDLDILISRLPNLVENYIVPDPDWSHNTHLWGVNASKYVFEQILNYFEVFNVK